MSAIDGETFLDEFRPGILCMARHHWRGPGPRIICHRPRWHEGAHQGNGYQWQSGDTSSLKELDPTVDTHWSEEYREAYVPPRLSPGSKRMGASTVCYLRRHDQCRDPGDCQCECHDKVQK